MDSSPQLRYTSGDQDEPTFNPEFAALASIKFDATEPALGNVGFVAGAEKAPAKAEVDGETAGPEAAAEPEAEREPLISRVDGSPMSHVKEMQPDQVESLVGWNKDKLHTMTSKSEVTNLLDDAFIQGVLRREEKPGQDGEPRTAIVGVTLGAKEFYREAVGKIEEIKQREKRAASTRKQQARQKVDTVQAVTPPKAPEFAPDGTRIADTTPSLDALPPVPSEQAPLVGPNYIENPVEAEKAAYRSESARKAAVTRGENREIARKQADYITSEAQALEAAYAAKETMDARHELQQRQAEMSLAAERLGKIVGLEVPDQTDRIAELKAHAETQSEAAIKQYAETLAETLNKTVKIDGGMVRETLRDKQLATIDDLRTALGVPVEPLHMDSDRASITHFYESNINADKDGKLPAERVILIERFDRKTGRLVEASIARGEDLIKTNRKGERVPTKALATAMTETHTETSYVAPTEKASLGVITGTGDLGISGAIMRRRGASGVEVANMERTKQVKRRKSWWQRALEGARS